MTYESSLTNSDISTLEYGALSGLSLLDTFEISSIDDTVSGNDIIDNVSRETFLTTEYVPYDGEFTIFNDSSQSYDVLIYSMFIAFALGLSLILVVKFVRLAINTFKSLS